jgi:hypothetical protein
MTIQFVEHLEKCFDLAYAKQSNVDSGILEIDGATGEMTRHFYNNLLTMKGARYLEVGTYKGSSVCAAMCNNTAKVVCVDNWSEFDGPKEEFLANYKKYKGKNDATFIEQDCFTLDTANLGKFNIYMYDGNHSSDSHYKALSHFIPCLDDTFVFIVDDWNWDQVRNGTLDAIRDLGLSVLWKKEIRLTNDGSHTEVNEAKATWWNGIFVCVLQK